MAKPDFHLGIFKILNDHLQDYWRDCSIGSKDEDDAERALFFVARAMAGGDVVDEEWIKPEMFTNAQLDLIRPWLRGYIAPLDEDIEARFTAYKVAEALRNA